MKKFRVIVRREIVESFDIEIEAHTPEQAEAEALIKADHPDYSFDWSQSDTTITAEAQGEEQFPILAELAALEKKYRGCDPV